MVITSWGSRPVPVSIARTLAHREQVVDSQAETDFRILEGLVERLGAHAASLGAIEKAARTAKKSSDTILVGAEGMRQTLEREIDALVKHLAGLRSRAGAP